MVVGDDVRRPILDVLDGLADEHREEAGERRHLVHEELRAEAAACRDGHEAELAGGDLERARDQPEEVGEVHRVGMDRDDARAGVVIADRAVRVHRHPGRARPVQLRRHRPVGLLERPVDLAEGERALVRGVRPECLVHERRSVLAGRDRVEHDRKLLVARPRSARRRPLRRTGSRRSRPRPSRRSAAPSRSRSCPGRSARRRRTAAAPHARPRPCR